MGQPVLMTGLDNGDRLSQDSALCTLLLSGVNRALLDWVEQENQRLWENDMREVKELAAGLRDTLASLRKDSADAKLGFTNEVARARINANKVKSLTKELSDANREVEEFLGDTGSNFPSSEDSNTQAPPAGVQVPHADINGITLNTESQK